MLAFVISSAGPVHAETLGDGNIQAMYAEASAAAPDAEKTRSLMMMRLDDSFVLKVNVSVVAGEKSQNFVQNLNKGQAIEDVMKTYGNSKLENFQNHIDKISYSADGKFAYVNDRTDSVRLASAQGPNGQIVQVHYEQSEACNDVVALAGGTMLKLVQSECNSAVNVHP